MVTAATGAGLGGINMATVPITVKRFLFEKGVPYRFLVHPGANSAAEAVRALGVEPATVVVARVLRDQHGTVLALYPATLRLNLEQLNHTLGRDLQAVAPREVPGCYGGVCLPLAQLYQLPAMIDESLLSAEQVYFPLNAQVLCRVSGADFVALQGKDTVSHDFVRSPGANASAARQERRERIRARIEATDDLPAMPKVAHELLQLTVNPYANASDLGAIVEQDPSLAAQLLRYANSPLYGYRGQVDSIRDVIARVLGYDLVMDIALGISVGRSFRNPSEGPLGLDAYWRHAVYCASLTQRLAERMPSAHRPRPGLAYLAGLLHNFGILLLGHLFPEDFRLLNEGLAREPGRPLLSLEDELIGVSHVELGAWLMQSWNMPDELVSAIGNHHDEEYAGSYAIYPNLVLLANRLLAAHQIGDEHSVDLPGDLLARLAITDADAHAALAAVLEHADGLNIMASRLAA